MSEVETVLDLDFDVDDKALDLLVELVVGSLNEGNDEVDDLCAFLGLDALVVIELFLVFEGGVKHGQGDLD